MTEEKRPPGFLFRPPLHSGNNDTDIFIALRLVAYNWKDKTLHGFSQGAMASWTGPAVAALRLESTDGRPDLVVWPDINLTCIDTTKVLNAKRLVRLDAFIEKQQAELKRAQDKAESIASMLGVFLTPTWESIE